MGKLSISVRRKLAQVIVTLLTNANFAGFAKGAIYSGKLKQICVPGLNCYSCPGALGACPLGSLQTMLADPGYKWSFYVVGLLAAFGIVLGRAVCGWLCPFGFLQELLHAPVKLAGKRLKKLGEALKKFRLPFFFRYTKYILLVFFVILLPLLLTDQFGFGAPYFCELVCPAGTIEAAVPLLLANPPLRALSGALFYLKVTIAVLVAAGALASNRFFCKYLCPLGAIYGFFNRIAMIRLSFCGGKCTNCGRCVKVCVMDIDPRSKAHRAECICCGKCVRSCEPGALKIGR